MSLTGSTSTVTLDDGTKAFCKALPGAPEGFFAFEAAGLRALGALGARVPRVHEVTEEHLLIELVEAKTSDRIEAPEYTFGQELAQLHLAGQAAAGSNQMFGSLAGLSRGYLGGAEVDLRPAPTLYESLVVNRIVPLTKQAIAAGRLDHKALGMAESITAQHLGLDEPPTVVHGDLWAGNRMVDASGTSWLIDPSCHWGHREQDIAMMQLFGGFGVAVLDGYNAVFPLAEGWRARVPLFQLVPLLVHVLLFGGAYVQATMLAFEETLANKQEEETKFQHK